MTFAAVGSTTGGNTGSISLTPHTVGNFFLLEVINFSDQTVFATALSSSNATWATLGSQQLGSTFNGTARAFIGKVTSTSTATVTITWSGTTPANIEWAAQEFSATVGASSVTFDTSGHIDSAGTSNWASLTPAHGAGELYFGYAANGSTATSGSTSGYVYAPNADGTGNGSAYNVSCPNSATFPVWGDSTEQFGIMVLVYEASAAGPAGTTQPRATVPVPRRRLARGLWGGVGGQAFVKVPAPAQQYRLAPRRVPARAVWRGSSPFLGFVAVPAPRQPPVTVFRRRPARGQWEQIGGQAFVKVPAPAQQYRTPPRRQLARVTWRGITGQAFVQVPAPRQLQPIPRRKLARAVVPFPMVVTVPSFVAVPAPRQLPVFPRRRPARAYMQFRPVATTNAAPPPFVPRGQPPQAPDDKSYIKKLILLS